MSQDSFNLTLLAYQPEPVTPGQGGSVLVKVNSGDTVYYGQTTQVSASSNDGSIASGGTQTFTTNVWLRSAGTSSVSVTTSLTQSVEERSSSIKTAAYAVQATDSEVLADVSGGSFSFTLYPATGSGRRHKVAVSVPTGSQSSANVLSIVTAPGDALGDYNQAAPVLGALSQSANAGRLTAATYYVAVVAVVQVGGVIAESLVSNERSITVAGTRLAIPTFTVATSTSGGTLPTATNYRYWTTAADVSGNETPLSYGITNPGTMITTGAGGTNQNTITFTPVTGATQHYLYRQECSGTGIGHPMQRFAMGTSGTYADGTPYNSSNDGVPQDVGAGGASITASWPAVPGALFYRWLRATTAGGVSNEYDVPAAAGTVTFTDLGLPSQRQRARPTVDGTVLQLGLSQSGALYRAVELADIATGAWEVLA